MHILVYFLFAISGFAGLIYEGSWARYLKLFLGHSSYGQVLTLCIYMGGLAVGSFLAGKLVEKIKNPLLGYAGTEFFIGLGGIFYHPIYKALTEFFFSSSLTDSLSSTTAEIVKICLAVLSTLPIAIAVGMTFPFIAAGLLRKSKNELSLPHLYFTNSLGSAIGILATSYILIPKLGNQMTLGVAASINFLLAISFCFIAFHLKENENTTEKNIESQDFTLEQKKNPKAKVWLYVALITGLTSFVYEIVWIRLLSLLMGSSSHSFDQMLSAFILGLAIGSFVSGKWIKKDSLVILCIVQICMAFFALCTLYFHEPFFILMNESNQVFNQTNDGYTAWSIFKYLLSVLWMVPTSFFAGMTLPLITLILTRLFKSEAPIGKVYGYNTIGSILGSAGGGLILLPLLKLKWTLVLAAFLDFAIGFVLLVVYRKAFRKSPVFYIVSLFLLLPAFFVEFSPELITSGAFRAYKNLHPDEKIIVEDGKTATISFHETKVHYYVKTNGKTDASLNKDRTEPISSDELTQAATAFIPMGILNKPYDATMIGFGSGMGAHYLLSDPLLKSLDCIEIEEKMMDLAKGFYPWNRRGYDDKRMHIFIDDAGTFFHTHNKKYDLMISVPSNPWVSGVASLFSYEFYNKMKKHLNPGGLFVQWIQTYEFNDKLFLNILKALDKEFAHITLYKSPEEPDIIIVASDKPVQQKAISRFASDTTLIQEFKTIKRPPDFFGEQNFLFTAKMVESLLQGIEPNSTFKPIVDNEAEEARFLHLNAEIVNVFDLDSCEICYQEYLSEEDFALAKKAKTENNKNKKMNAYKEFTMNAYLNTLELKEDTVFSDSAMELFYNFRTNYLEEIFKIPLSLRDSIPLYKNILNLVQKNKMPDSFQKEFMILEYAKNSDYQNAVLLLADFIDAYEIKDMERSFIRNALTISFLAHESALAYIIYKEAVLTNPDFKPIEKRFIEREIQKLRKKGF